jgi:hypothetical protein
VNSVHPLAKVSAGILEDGVFEDRESVATIFAVKVFRSHFTVINTVINNTAMMASYISLITNLDEVVNNRFFSRELS